MTLFEELNAPFPYKTYKYDKFNDNCYVSGQSVAERLNQVLGVGMWRYKGLYETEKVTKEKENARIKIFVEFSIYNQELKEWITFVDAGSEQIKSGMNSGDATKSAITDGMKKCASRIGVASDLYNGLINYDKNFKKVIIPESYKEYYEKMEWEWPNNNPGLKKPSTTQKPSTQKSNLKTIEAKYEALYGDMNDFDDFMKEQQQKGFAEHQTEKYLTVQLSYKQKKGA